MYDSYFLRFEYLYVSGYYCVEGREVMCNLYIYVIIYVMFFWIEYFFYFLGFGCNVLFFMYFNNIVDS